MSEDVHSRPEELLVEGRPWLRRIVGMQEQRLGFRQRWDTLELAGWLALLAGGLEYDMGDRRASEATRRLALSLGQEVGSAGILGWAHEMKAWFALTSGDYRGVVAAARAGQTASGSHSVGVQLIAQEAKACPHLGRRGDPWSHGFQRLRTASRRPRRTWSSCARSAAPTDRRSPA
jgi:hypothetical protein